MAVASGLMLMTLSTTSMAADPDHVNVVEFTPFAGFMTGGEFEDPIDGSDRDVDEDTNFGLFVDLIADGPDRHYEFLYTKQSTLVDATADIGTVTGAPEFDLDVEYLHIGGTVSFTDSRYVIPFFGITVGATRFSPDDAGLGTSLDTETKLSFTVGGGLKVPITNNIGIRLDTRAFITLLDTDSDIFCVSAPPVSGCRISAKSDTFLQYSAMLGITAGF